MKMCVCVSVKLKQLSWREGNPHEVRAGELVGEVGFFYMVCSAQVLGDKTTGIPPRNPHHSPQALVPLWPCLKLGVCVQRSGDIRHGRTTVGVCVHWISSVFPLDILRY